MIKPSKKTSTADRLIYIPLLLLITGAIYTIPAYALSDTLNGRILCKVESPEGPMENILTRVTIDPKAYGQTNSEGKCGIFYIKACSGFASTYQMGVIAEVNVFNFNPRNEKVCSPFLI